MFLTYLSPRLAPAFLLCSSSLTKPFQFHHSSPPLSFALLLWLVCLASFSHLRTSFGVPNLYHISHLSLTHFISTPGLPVSFPVGSILLWFLPLVVRSSVVPYFFFSLWLDTMFKMYEKTPVWTITQKNNVFTCYFSEVLEQQSSLSGVSSSDTPRWLNYLLSIRLICVWNTPAFNAWMLTTTIARGIVFVCLFFLLWTHTYAHKKTVSRKPWS